jgi:nitroreductase
LSGKLASPCLDQLFRDARTHNVWLDRDVPDALLHELVDLVKLGPTSANCSPARFLFVKSREAKEKLKPHLSEGNRDKTMKAPSAPSSATISISISTCPSFFPTPTPRAGSRATSRRSSTPRFATGRCKAPISS